MNIVTTTLRNASSLSTGPERRRPGWSRVSHLLIIGMLTGAATATSVCADSAQSGALIGAGAGALIGQAIGRDTTGTLIGTGAGALGGYIIGNEVDKGRTRSHQDGYNRGNDSYYNNRDW